MNRAPVNVIGSRARDGSTKHFMKYPIDEDLKTFMDWHQTLDGKEHSVSQAQQITVDVSKYLHCQIIEVADASESSGDSSGGGWPDIVTKYARRCPCKDYENENKA